RPAAPSSTSQRALSPAITPSRPGLYSFLALSSIALFDVVVPLFVLRIAEELIEPLAGLHLVQRPLLGTEALQLFQQRYDSPCSHPQRRDREQHEAIAQRFELLDGQVRETGRAHV